MIRRKPTKIELKADDIEEYDEILREREKAASASVVESMSETGNYNGKSMEKTGKDLSATGNVHSQHSKRKMAVAKRIGIER